MRNIRVTMLAPLFFFLLCLGASVGCSVSQAAEVRTIQIQLEQWNSLKEKTKLLEAKLSLASDILTTQKLTSEKLLTQLSEAKKQLSRTQEELTSSKRSLESAKNSLKKSSELYEQLMKQIEQEQKKTRRIRTQRNVYATCAVIAVVAVCIK